MHVTITTNRTKFDLKFSGKFNFLIGSSGSKKTYLITSLQKFKRGIRNVKCKIEDSDVIFSNHKIHVFSNEFMVDGDIEQLFNTTGDIYFIDESCGVLQEPTISKILLQSKNYFVIVSRTVAGWLPVSIDSIYHLESINGIVKNVPVYCNNNAELTNIRSRIDHISTEDSVSSLCVLKHLFQDKLVTFGNAHEVINGKSVSRDNSQLANIVENELNSGLRSILIVFDASAYGVYYDSLLSTLRCFKNDSVSILAWESFEWFILGSEPWNRTITKDDVGYNYNSIEQLSEKILSDLINYKKTRTGIPKCLLDYDNKCAYRCYKSCEFSGKFHLANLLRGSLLDVQNALMSKNSDNELNEISHSTTNLTSF